LRLRFKRQKALGYEVQNLQNASEFVIFKVFTKIIGNEIPRIAKFINIFSSKVLRVIVKVLCLIKLQD